MNHRYGRHGAGAWLRHYLKKRKNWQQSLPAIHASFSVTPIALPGFRGKAFLVLMQDDELNPQQPTDEGQFQIDRRTIESELVQETLAQLPNTEQIPAISKEEQYITEMAKDTVRRSLKKKMTLPNPPTWLSIDRDALEQWEQQEGEKVARTSPFALSLGYVKTREIHKAAFHCAIKESPYASRFIKDQDKHFQELVQEDINAGRLSRTSEVDAYLYEAGAIRAIEELKIPHDQLLELENWRAIREWAKPYHEARRNPKTWEVWPVPGSDFRLDF